MARANAQGPDTLLQTCLRPTGIHLQTGGGPCIRYTQPTGGYCLKALRVNSRTRLAFAPGDARYVTS